MTYANEIRKSAKVTELISARWRGRYIPTWPSGGLALTGSSVQMASSNNPTAGFKSPIVSVWADSDQGFSALTHSEIILEIAQRTLESSAHSHSSPIWRLFSVGEWRTSLRDACMVFMAMLAKFCGLCCDSLKIEGSTEISMALV